MWKKFFSDFVWVLFQLILMPNLTILTPVLRIKWVKMITYPIILLCPAFYWSQHYTVSSTLSCPHLPKGSFVHLSHVNMVRSYHSGLAFYSCKRQAQNDMTAPCWHVKGEQKNLWVSVDMIMCWTQYSAGFSRMLDTVIWLDKWSFWLILSSKLVSILLN